MSKKDEINKFRLFSRRAFVVGIAQFALVGAVLTRYLSMQLFETSTYTKLAERNRLKEILITPKRGDIVDRNGILIASNTEYFKLIMDPYYNKEAMDIINNLNQHLSHKLDITEQDIKRRNQKRMFSDYLTIANDLNWSFVSRFYEVREKFPELDVVVSYHRNYFLGEAACHLTGYIGPPNKDELFLLELPKSGEVKIGKSGIEKSYQDHLCGEFGYTKNEFDVRGNHIRTISEEAPIKGQNLVLSIDAELQSLVAHILKERGVSASVVVMDARNGEVLALHSSPTFDPNQFVEGVSKTYWDQLINTNKTYPLINHCISSVYPPGSTFKLVTCLAALEHGVSPDMKNHCPGYFMVGSRVVKCWNHAGHGTIDMKTAIAQSCNPYMFKLALQIGNDRVMNTARKLGLGALTEINLPNEVASFIPDDAWKRKRYKLKWYPGDTVNASIGQGYMLATPIQIARMTARIASGFEVSPKLEMTSTDAAAQLDFANKNLAVIREGMFMCVNSPVGVLYSHNMSIGDFTVCGKTGTAQVISAKKMNSKIKENRHHALFTSFAPYDDPKYVVTVVVEHGEGGARAAAPIAKEVYKFLKSKL